MTYGWSFLSALKCSDFRVGMWQPVTSTHYIIAYCVNISSIWNCKQNLSQQVFDSETRLTSLSLTLATRYSIPINKQAPCSPLFCRTVLPPALCWCRAALQQTLQDSCWAPQQPPRSIWRSEVPLSLFVLNWACPCIMGIQLSAWQS